MLPGQTKAANRRGKPSGYWPDLLLDVCWRAGDGPGRSTARARPAAQTSVKDDH
jgi:hypothetical protein